MPFIFMVVTGAMTHSYRVVTPDAEGHLGYVTYYSAKRARLFHPDYPIVHVMGEVPFQRMMREVSA